MKLIVGLGNPGEKYEQTRHNLGFTVVEQFLKDLESAKNGIWDDNKKFKSDIFVLEYQPKVGVAQKIILAKPKTYMNNSGMAVSLISNFYKIKPEDIWVVHDELDLPIGNMKIRFGGGTAGHHGLDSIMESLGTDKFWRFRMGIGEDKNPNGAKHLFKNTKDFVLNKFNSHEARNLKHLVKKGTQALSFALEKDLQSAMNRFNTN